MFEVYQWSNVWEKIDWSEVGYAGGSTTYCKDMSVYQNLAAWNETTVAWSNYSPSTTNMEFTPEDTMTLAERKPFLGAEYPSGGQAHWETFDVSDMTYNWLEGKESNYGLSIMPTIVNKTLVSWEHTVYYSSDHTTSYDTYKPKLTIDVDTNNNGFPDAQYVLQPSDGKDAWIAQSSLNSGTRESGSDLYLLPNIYNTTQGYSSIGSYYRRGLVEFDLSGISWRAENSAIWENPSFNLTVDVKVNNSNPELITTMQNYHLQGDIVEFDITISDPGSDDLNFTYDFGDGSMPIMGGYFYNDGVAADADDSCFTGVAPFELNPKITHIFYDPGEYLVNFSINDDDGGHANETILIKIPTAKELKEEAVRILEPLVPGRWGYVGYQNLTLKFHGMDDRTVLSYNHISRMPFYDETKLLYTFCDVDYNETIFVDASSLDTGMFGEELILKVYSANRTLIGETTIPTTYSCLYQLEPGQRYGPWEIVDIGRKNATTYHHYSQFAIEVENAMDNILFSLNKNPRRGYGWWHTHWVWYCGYWIQRELWLGNSSIDPQFGSIVFCEELYAVQHLMTVINNCLKPDGVHNMTFRWTGKQMVDIEVYSYGVWWKWWNNWEHTHSFHNVTPGEELFIGSKGYPLCGKLAERTLIKVYKYNTGELLDAVYIRTSGFWPLEVEPGNMYNLIEITGATLKLGCGTFWREWFGDYNAFDYMDWQVSRAGCGWEKEDCYDEQVASEEEARICSNLSAVKSAIDLLVMADDLIARVAYWDAENMTANNASNQDEYDFHFKMAKRYMLRARREADMGRPHRAIRDFKLSWQNSILATKWIILSAADDNGTTDPADGHPHPDFDCDCFCYMNKYGKDGLWWLWWYIKYQVKLQQLFSTFPDWKDYTDPEVWGGNEGGEESSSGSQGAIYRKVRSGWYIGYEDYYSDYDYNDWSMEMHETRYVNDCSKGISKIHIEFIADANEAGYKHYIHLRIGIEQQVKYKWTVSFYNHKDQLLDTKNSNGYVSGEFDQIIFDTAKFPFKHNVDPYKTVVDIKFEKEIRTIDIDKGPYDPYMHVRTTGKMIHTYTTRPTTKSEAKGSSPSLADKYVPMLLVIDDVDFEPPKDGVRIWTVYDKFDDWVVAGYSGNVQWWV
jgi:LruC domain-containing protein